MTNFVKVFVGGKRGDLAIFILNEKWYKCFVIEIVLIKPNNYLLELLFPI